MLTYLVLLCSVLRRELRARQDLVAENLALRQQLAVLSRPKRRLRLTPTDRLFWSCLSSLWSSWRSTLQFWHPTGDQRLLFACHPAEYRTLNVDDAVGVS